MFVVVVAVACPDKIEVEACAWLSYLEFVVADMGGIDDFLHVCIRELLVYLLGCHHTHRRGG